MTGGKKVVTFLRVSTIGCLIVGSFIVADKAFGGHNSCGDCHLRGKALKTNKINELCISCHPDNVKDHVLNVISETSPKGLPLDSENRITCITCHDAHDKAGRQNMLRMDQSEICAPCHPDSKGPL